MTPWRQRLVPIGLALLCLAAYANSFGVGFTLDSRQLILNDARVHAFTRENLSLIAGHTYWWPFGESGLYRPLTTLTYLLNYAVLGNANRPEGYHGFNLLLHIANVLMFFRLTRRVSASEWTAAAASAMWAVAPLSTEAVTNIVGRADLMAAAGSLAAMLLYVRLKDSAEARSGDPGGRKAGRAAASRALRITGIALVIVAGALSKESAVAALGLLLAWEFLWWAPGRSLHTLLATLLTCAASLCLWLIQRAEVLGRGLPAEFPFTDNPIVGSTFWPGRLTALQVMGRYLLLLAWPARLSNDYSYAQVPLASGTPVEWLTCLLLVGGTVGALWRLRAQRDVLFFAAFALITFLPASNLLFQTGTIMGERLVYLPSAGLAGLAAIGLGRLGTTPRRRWTASAIVTLIVVGCASRTHARNPDWTNDVTLWRTAVTAAPASAKAHSALAEALYAADPTHENRDEVIREAEKSVALLEGLPDERNMFQAFRQAGAFYLDKANQAEGNPRDPGTPEIRRLYSRALVLLDRAVRIARAGASRIRGASLGPEADAQRLRAVALMGLEDPSLALAAANRSRALSPRPPLAYRLAAAALLSMGRSEEAVATLLAGSIVSDDPDLAQAAMTLYRDGLDPVGCALTGSGPTAALNLRCPIVLRHWCLATAAAYQILNNAGHPDRAGETKAAASAIGCPADLLDRANSLVP